MLNSTRRKVELASRGLDHVSKWVCISLILAMSVEVLVAVFFRYALNAPIKWGEELARLLMVWAGLLGIGIALKDGEHIGLEALTGRLKGRSLCLVKLTGNILVLIFVVVLFIWGINLSRQAWETYLPGMRISWTWSFLAVPVTAAIQICHLLARIFSELEALSESPKPDNGISNREVP